MSLKEWHKLGILEREIEIFSLLALHFRKIYLLTYGDRSDLNYKKYLPENVQILPKTVKISDLLYSFLLPFIYRKQLKECYFFKSNQMLGSWATFLSSLFFSGKFILRTGYTWSLFHYRRSDFWFYLITTLIESLMYRFSDTALVTSKGDWLYVTSKYNLNSEKIKVVPNYINTELFKPLNISKNFNKIIFIGRISPEKNLSNLIEALSDMDLELDIIGDGKIKNELYHKAKTEKVSVNFLGIKPNYKIPQILNRYSMFILPSFHEGMPKVLLEAMSCGLACIATNVEGSKELISHYKTGLLADNCSPVELRKMILKLKDDVLLQHQLGRNACKFVVENFSQIEVFKKEIKAYFNLISDL